MASRGHDLLQRFQRLGTATLAVGFAGAVVASRVVPRQGAAQLDQTRQLLHQVRDDVLAAQAIVADPVVNASVRQIETTLTQIERVTTVPDRRSLRALDQEVCVSAQAAVVFLSTGYAYDGGGAGSITLEVTGNDGAQQFTFASGTSQAHIITAINSFQVALGVTAAQSQVNPARVSVSSEGMDADAFVRIREVDGPAENIIFAYAEYGVGMDDYQDFGRNAITLSAWRP
jgi:hypothetical protein